MLSTFSFTFPFLHLIFSLSKQKKIGKFQNRKRIQSRCGDLQKRVSVSPSPIFSCTNSPSLLFHNWHFPSPTSLLQTSLPLLPLHTFPLTSPDNPPLISHHFPYFPFPSFLTISPAFPPFIFPYFLYLLSTHFPHFSCYPLLFPVTSPAFALIISHCFAYFSSH